MEQYSCRNSKKEKMSKILLCPDCGVMPKLYYSDIKHYTGSQFWGARYFCYICPECSIAGYPKSEYKGIALRYWNNTASGKRKTFAIHLSDKEKQNWYTVTSQKERHFGVCCNEENDFCISDKYQIL